MASKRKTSDEDIPEVGLVPDPDDDEMAEGFSIADADGEVIEDEVEEDDEDADDFEVDEDAIIEDVEAVIAEGDVAPAAVTVAGAVVVAEDASVQIVSDDDDDEVEGVRPGIDFICDVCHLVKRTSQLAKRSKTKGLICSSCV